MERNDRANKKTIDLTKASQKKTPTSLKNVRPFLGEETEKSWGSLSLPSGDTNVVLKNTTDDPLPSFHPSLVIFFVFSAQLVAHLSSRGVVLLSSWLPR